MTAAELRESILRYLKYSLGKDAAHATIYDWRVALSLAKNASDFESLNRCARW